MPVFKRIFLLFLLLNFSFCSFAQDTDDPATNYKTALSLVNANKGPEGIPYLEKVIKTTSAYAPAAYSLLGSIYDANHQAEKAIAAYKDGINAYPQNQDLYYNLGLVYFRNKQYADAETAAIEAIKLDPKHANSQRMYALVTFHQNKRVNALLGFCSFLLLEPSTARSTEAFNNIQSILKGGALKEDGIGTLSPADTKERAALNTGLTAIITSPQAKKLTGTAQLEYELKSIFTLAGQAAEKKMDKTFFAQFYVTWFYQLAQSSNMAAFAKMVSEHTPLSGDLDSWVKGTDRGF